MLLAALKQNGRSTGRTVVKAARSIGRTVVGLQAAVLKAWEKSSGL